MAHDPTGPHGTPASGMSPYGCELGTVRSGDGTIVGYRRRGCGPGVVLLHGGMESSSDYDDLASALATAFTVYVPDRRGRGRSGPHGPEFGVDTEVADVRALVEQTGARFLFGVSSGAVIALLAALHLPAIERVAAYEPPITGQDDGSEVYVARFESEVDRGDLPGAIVTMLKGMRMGPRWLRLLPRPVATMVVARFVASEAGAAGGAPTIAELAPTMRYDFRVAEQGSSDPARFRGLHRPTLLLGGDRSPRYLAAALDDLELLLPEVRRVRLPDVAHNASSNRGEGGRPDLVAAALLDFLPH